MSATKTKATNLRRGEDYLRDLDDGRVVYIEGQKIDNVATHPLTRDYARRTADFYDLHFDPALEETLTYVDDAGTRRSRTWQLPFDKAGVQERRKFHETVARKIGAGQFGRLPDANASVLITLIDDPDPWEKNSIDTDGRGLADNIRRHWAEFVRGDRNVVPIFIDSQPNRSDTRAYETSPDLRLASTDDDGIVVDGCKAVSTGPIFADWCFVGLFFRPGVLPEQCLFFFVKPNTPGLTFVGRKSSGIRTDTENHPLSGLGEEFDTFQFFDNVCIPWSQVIHIGNLEHAQHYPQRVFDWLHYQDLVRQTVKAELMAGLAIILCEVTGTIKIPGVQARVADIVRFREAVRAHLIAAEDTGFATPGGLYKPNNLLFDFGRAYYNEHAPHFIQEIIDLAGRGPVMIPSDGDWQNPDLKPLFEPLMKGPSSNADKLKVFRVIRDLFLTDWGRRNAMFDNFNGTPLTALRLLTMMRAEYRADGPLTALARSVCGLNEIAASAAGRATADYARAQDVRTA